MNRFGEQSATESLNMSASLFDGSLLPLLPLQQFLHPADNSQQDRQHLLVPNHENEQDLSRAGEQVPPSITASDAADVKPVVSASAQSFGGNGVTELKLAGRQLIGFPQEAFHAGGSLYFLNLSRNMISAIPSEIHLLSSLVQLNLSKNQLDHLPHEVTQLRRLVRLDVSGNYLSALPSGFSELQSLRELRIDGNLFDELPSDIFELSMLMKLYIGSNRLRVLPPEIGNLKNLELLYCGGNKLTSVPNEIGGILNLAVLYLGDNKISSMPESICRLRRLRTLNLHNNKLKFLPQPLIQMSNLENLSLRGNPLVTDFINDTSSAEPLSLLELAGRAVLNNNIPYDEQSIPQNLVTFLNSAQRCNNPACAGVYFTTNIKKFQVMDFCGKFRVPLMKFLCKEKCNETASFPATSTSPPCKKKLKKVLLTGYKESPVN
eukprot:m.124472 g.124472  ORF g.124472 m.124472 type:complete len:434 (+) comp17290_c0_seq1:330-1631(+)